MYRLCAAAACGLLVSLSTAASAATLTATFAQDYAGFPVILGGIEVAAGSTAFEIEFDDSLGSLTGILEGAEFLSFAWVNNPFMLASTLEPSRELLGNAPTLAGLIEGFRPPGFSNSGAAPGSVWEFRQAFNTATLATVATDVFTYEITGLTQPPPPAVPLPASVLLLAAGVAGLGALRRRAAAA